jgi:hypothetical protein
MRWSVGSRAMMGTLHVLAPRASARAPASGGGVQRRHAMLFASGRRSSATPCGPPCASPYVALCGGRRAWSRALCSATTGAEEEDTEEGLAEADEGAAGEGETEWQQALDNLQRPSTQELHPGLYAPPSSPPRRQ